MIKDEIVVFTVGEFNDLQEVVGKTKFDKRYGFVAVRKGKNTYGETPEQALEKCYNRRVRTLSDGVLA